MIQSNRSYWENELYDVQYDLAVIGAGLVGQSLAYFFKKEHPEARVLVLERGFHPIGASTRNAGFACIGSISEHMADLEIESESVVKNRIKRRFEGLELLREVLGDKCIEYDDCGGWEIFSEEESFLKARDHVEMVNDWLYEAIGLQNVYKPDTYHGLPAIFNKVEGALHSGKMMATIHRMNIGVGVEFRWSVEVAEIDSGKGMIALKNGQKLRTSQVAITTNAFTKTLFPEIAIKPGRGYIMLTEAGVNQDWHGTFHYDKGYIYFRNIGDDRLLLGGARNVDYEGEETTEFGVNQSIKKALIEFGNDVLKLKTGWGIEQEWSGIMGFTETKTPILKRYNEKILVATGLSGMGVALGMQLGKEAAELL